MEDKEQRQVFERWLDEHRGIMFKITYAFAFTPRDQEDLFQEISLQVWQSIPNFEGGAKASTWIYRVALYAATVWARKEKKEPPTRALAEVGHTLAKREAPQDGRVEWLYEQIGQMEVVDRALCLLLLDGFSYKEMAGLVGISESYVGVKIHRIKKHLVRMSKEIEYDGV